MRAFTFIVLAITASAYAAPGISRRALGCPAEDKVGSKLQNARTIDSDDGTELACVYPANTCTYFPENGNFASGSSDCPAGLIDGGVTADGSGAGSSTAAGPTSVADVSTTSESSASSTADTAASQTAASSSTQTAVSSSPATTSGSSAATRSSAVLASSSTATEKSSDPHATVSSTDATGSHPASSSAAASTSASAKNGVLPLGQGSGLVFTVGAVLVGSLLL